MQDIAVEARSLSKWYGSLKAVDGVSFEVPKGASFGLLGLNGAGKTTTFKMMVSLIRPDSGTAMVAGYDVVKSPLKVRGLIGYVAENPSFYGRMSTVETLRYICSLLNVPARDVNRRIDQVLELVGLSDKKSVLVGGYSRGMRHRLGIAQALLSEPRVLFLDEPTLGLDPLGARNMRELIKQLRAHQEVTILMSSHALPEVEAICDLVGIFDHGRVVAMDTIRNLRSTCSDSTNLELLIAQPNPPLMQSLRELAGVNHIQQEGLKLHINTIKNAEIRAQIIKAAVDHNAQVLTFGLQESSLEDILLRLVGNGEEHAEPVTGLLSGVWQRLSHIRRHS